MNPQDIPIPGISISYLIDYQQHLETLASWSFHEWGHYFPGETLNDFVEDYRGYLAKDTIPLAVVAHKQGQAVGTAALFNNDSLPGFDHLTPWLAAVYVDAAYRRQGIGQALVSRIVSEANKLGNTAIYLWTGSEAAWYQKQGWQSVATTLFQGHTIDVMKRDLP